MTTKSNHYYYLRALAEVLVALAAAMSSLAGQARPANAAFPGKNGKIVFTSDRTTVADVNNPDGDHEIFTMNKDGSGATQLTFNAQKYDIDPTVSPELFAGILQALGTPSNLSHCLHTARKYGSTLSSVVFTSAFVRYHLRRSSRRGSENDPSRAYGE